MNIILKIGNQEFLLPNSTGVENLMRVIAKAVKVCDRTWDTDDPRIEVDLRPIEVGMKFVPPEVRYFQERTNQPVDVWSELPAKRKAIAGQKLLKGY